MGGEMTFEIIMRFLLGFTMMSVAAVMGVVLIGDFYLWIMGKLHEKDRKQKDGK